MYYFSLAKCSVRRTWNFHTITKAWKSYSTQSSSASVKTKALTQPTYVVARQPVPSLPELDRLSRIGGKHILWVDLEDLKYGQGEVVHYYYYSVDMISTKWHRLDGVLTMIRKLEMMNKLKQFLEADALKPPSARIDSVQWQIETGREPTKEMWQILNGLSSPKHLELISGRDEEFNVESLKDFEDNWNDLDTLTLTNICDNTFMENPPDVFSRISSLALVYCCGLNFIPPAATRLKHVRILENNACDMFIHAVDHNPCFPLVLEVLEIESTNGCDFSKEYEPQDFRDRLLKCTNLREFRFASGYSDSMDTDLASYIPPSVEKLSLSFTRSLPFLYDFDDWIKHASDPTWLPHLKSFQLNIDPKSRVRGLEGELLGFLEHPRKLENPPREMTPEAFDMEFERKRTVLYDVLKSTRPSMNLLV